MFKVSYLYKNSSICVVYDSIIIEHVIFECLKFSFDMIRNKSMVYETTKITFF